MIDIKCAQKLIIINMGLLRMWTLAARITNCATNPVETITTCI